MAIYTSKFTQQEIDDGIDNANSAVQPEDLKGYLPLTGGTITNAISGSDGTYILKIAATGASKWGRALALHCASMTSNTDICILFGQSDSNKNQGQLYFHYSGASSTSNRIGLGFHSVDDLLNILATGYVGIGTTSPSYKLDVNGDLHSGGSLYITNVASGSYNEGIRIANTKDSSYCGICIGCDPSATTGTHANQWQIGRDDSNNFFWNVGGSVIMRLTKAGNLGVGTTSPSYKLHVAGAVGATGYNNASDIRKKDIIENLDLDVEDIANAPLFKFSWLDPEMPEGVNVGTSAQYWKTIIPEIVSEANDDEKTLSMQYGVAGLASSIALARKIVEQENTIKAQEARIKALEDAIAEIQNKLK